ncbi:Zinc finger protein 26 [Plakobranchus ocellatus]|uniref:Zinc finger protein 26 n=1 Tax=Plakobranchus ocellatus TaxID=259542 RepID=A0AAV4A1V5_9GAST|nr:Zinc finger protein 26 [Plakobranchus ocellatus]
MESQASNSITICLPPSLSLSEINAENLRSVVEAAYQSSQDAFNQNGEIILYVKEQDQDAEQQQYVFEPVDGEGILESKMEIQPKLEPDMDIESLAALQESAALIQLQQQDLLSSEEGMIIPVADADQLAAAAQLHIEGVDENADGTKTMMQERTIMIPSVTSLQPLPASSPQKLPYRGTGIVKQAIQPYSEKKMTDKATIEKVINERAPKNGPPTFDLAKLKKEKLTTPLGSKIFCCKVCDYRAATRTLLKQHEVIHSAKSFKCKQCNYSCHTASHLKRHMFTHSKSKPILCSQCGYTCTQNFQMRAHLLQHETDKPFVCTICNATYKKEDSLKVHMLGHENVAKFRCTECNYAGNRFGDFKRHMLTHTTDKPLKCSICSYTCIRHWRLKAHMKIHNSNKPLLRCDVCDFTCVSAPRLKDHKASHSKDGIIRCEVCEYVCTQPSRMKRHMKAHINATTKTYTGTSFPPGFKPHKPEVPITETSISDATASATPMNITLGDGVNNLVDSANISAPVPSDAPLPDADANIIAENQYDMTAAAPEEEQTFVSLQPSQSLGLDSEWVPETMDEEQFNAFAALAGKQASDTYTITTPDGGQTYIIQTDAPEQLAQQLAQAQLEQVQQIDDLGEVTPDFHEIIPETKPNPADMEIKVEIPEKKEPKRPLNHSKTKRFHCEQCDFSCDFKSTMTAHIKKHSNVKKYKCAHCDYMCNDTSRMKDHLLCHTTEKFFKCEHCDFSCKRRMGLKDHMKIHTGEKPFSCKLCDYKCRSNEGLKSHMAKHSGHKPYTCDVCGQGCSSFYLLKKHKFIHGEKPLKCTYCDYTCIQKKQLTNHLLQHKFQHPFCCTLCSATYKKEESLKIHMMSHQNIKKFVCNLCNYAGNRAADFRRHMLTHSSSKPLQCPQCSYSCIRQSRLKAHMLIHTQDRANSRRGHAAVMAKAYRCAFCDFTCARTSRLKAHLSKVHLDLPNNVIFSIDLKQVERA